VRRVEERVLPQGQIVLQTLKNCFAFCGIILILERGLKPETFPQIPLDLIGNKMMREIAVHSNCVKTKQSRE
jgi:hypothetical protein